MEDGVDVQVTLRPTKGFYVRRGQVRLVCEETFYVKGEEGGLGKSIFRWHHSEVPFLRRESGVLLVLFLNGRFSHTLYRDC